MKRSTANYGRGGTLLDLMVVVGIIGVLLAIFLPMMWTAGERSGRYKCADSLRQISGAMHRYALAHNGQFPTTRPTTGPTVLPDITNLGFDAADPNGIGGPPSNNVPAVIFLLVRGEYLPASALICPNTMAVPDKFDGKSPLLRNNFTDLKLNLSYAIQNPFANDAAIAAGFRWDETVPEAYVLAADRGPNLSGNNDLLMLTPSSPTELIRIANSANHGKSGQNVLFKDGRVEFCETPFVGIKDDNIYLTRDAKVLDSPVDAMDAILLPPDEPVKVMP